MTTNGSMPASSGRWGIPTWMPVPTGSPPWPATGGSSTASDIYALGILFYEMITGEKPFIGETTIDIMKQIMDKEPIEPGRFRDDMPQRLSHLIMRMLDKKRSSRPVIDEVPANLKYIDLHLTD